VVRHQGIKESRDSSSAEPGGLPLEEVELKRPDIIGLQGLRVLVLKSPCSDLKLTENATEYVSGPVLLPKWQEVTTSVAAVLSVRSLCVRRSELNVMTTSRYDSHMGGNPPETRDTGLR
jgi:hypothetical protein